MTKIISVTGSHQWTASRLCSLDPVREIISVNYICLRSLKLGILYKGYFISNKPTTQQTRTVPSCDDRNGKHQTNVPESSLFNIKHRNLCLILNTEPALTRRAHHNTIIHLHVHINDMTRKKYNNTRECAREYLTIA